MGCSPLREDQIKKIIVRDINISRESLECLIKERRMESCGLGSPACEGETMSARMLRN